jgi:hypothetical protein
VRVSSLSFAQGNHRIQVFSPEGTFLRLLGGSGSGGPSKGADKNQFTKPAALAIVSLRADGSVVQLHEAAEEASGTTEPKDGPASTAAATSHKSTITNTLVFVSDAANHRLQVFK